jgi:uncharacterized repeat protein (TIGR03943 family)
MPIRMYRLFQALILMSLGFFLGFKIINGSLSWYINQRFAPLTFIGIILLSIMAQAIARQREKEAEPEHDHGHEHEHEHDHVAGSNLLFLLIPLAIGVLIPARPLDSTALSTRGFTTSSALVGSGASSTTFEAASERRTILDWIKIFNYESDLSPYLNQEAAVIGFVYHDDKLPKNQFYVSRFVVSCCAADGFALAMVVEWPEAASLKQDTWVSVQGPVDALKVDDRNTPIIKAKTIDIVPAPDQPYLYP